MKSQPKWKRHSAAFNAKVGLEAVIGIKTVTQIARESSVNPVQVSQEKRVADLHLKIGERTVDLDYL